MSYEAVRKEYVKHTLEEKDCLKDPIEMLDDWLKTALKDNIDANAMTLCTADSIGMPSTRVVLIRDLNERGLVFYTNYTSQKAKDLEDNPNVAVNFFWPWLERQVRIQGRAVKLPSSESDAYFRTRPRESQLGAWASNQSDEMVTRDQLERQLEAYKQQFEGKEVDRPEYWGGYIIQPTGFEFWQGRASRLHDRIKYEPYEDGWSFKRLFP